MVQLSYSFCIAMLHSFWQAALLVLLYLLVDKLIHKNNAPLAKRNILYAAVIIQLTLFFFSFFLYFFDVRAIGEIAGLIQSMNSFTGETDFQTVTPWIFSIYIFVITFKILAATYSWFTFQKQYKNGIQKPAVDLKLFTNIKAHQFGIKRKVILWLSNSIQTPVTFGFLKPVILLPVALVNNISTLQAETLILHELTHIRTNDYLLNWVLMAAETIFFFNPIIISLCKKIRLEREKNCDINVVAFEYSPVLYAETLLQVERMKKMIPDFQLAAVNKKRQLLQRIEFFTNDKVNQQRFRFNIVAPLIGFLLLGMLSIALIFQSGKNGFATPSSAEIHALPLPFNNYVISATENESGFNAEINKPLTVAKLPALQTEPVADKQQQPETVKQVNTVSSTNPRMTENVIAPVAVDYALPVATKENDATRQILIKEEGSESATVKVYYLRFENGTWILEPEWIITAKEINTDTLVKKTDSLRKVYRKTYPAQQ